MRRVIRLNDPTSYGSKMICAAPHTTVIGKAVARKGDLAFVQSKAMTIAKLARALPTC